MAEVLERLWRASSHALKYAVVPGNRVSGVQVRVTRGKGRMLPRSNGTPPQSAHGYHAGSVLWRCAEGGEVNAGIWKIGSGERRCRRCMRRTAVPGRLYRTSSCAMEAV